MINPMQLALMLVTLTLTASFTNAQTDTDGDGLTDADETGIYGTLPFNLDTDGDRLTDSEEINTYGTDPLSRDTDGDGVDDFTEAWRFENPFWELNPLLPDTNGDGVGDGDTDIDGDGFPISLELRVDPAGSLQERWTTDFDGDGLTNEDELLVYFTDPSYADTDRDRLSDSDEIFVYFTDPFSPDTDGDGHLDGDEVQICGTNPTLADSNDDGTSDTCRCDLLTIQVHLVLDAELAYRFGADAESYARSVFETSQLTWNALASDGGPGVRIQLVGITAFAVGSNPWESSFDRNESLFGLALWSRANLPIEPSRDAVILLTGNGLNNYALGIAVVGGVGSRNSIGVVTVSGVTAQDGAVFSHELGHIMGAGHDGTSSACPVLGYIMDMYYNEISPTFSECSILEIQNTLSDPEIAAVLTPDCPSQCIADMNGDGILDLGDINSFVTLFLEGNISADMNGDGILDLGDINAFVSLFLAGC